MITCPKTSLVFFWSLFQQFSHTAGVSLSQILKGRNKMGNNIQSQSNNLCRTMEKGKVSVSVQKQVFFFIPVQHESS